MEETEKAKLRGAIRFFNGERNNIPVAVKTGDEIKPCGAIHLTEEILKEFEEIAGNRMLVLTYIKKFYKIKSVKIYKN